MKIEAGVIPTPFNDLGTQLGNQLTNAGSGVQIGDQRNLTQRTVTNIPAKVPSVIAYTATSGTPATATISVAAFTTLAGGGATNISYGAMSTSVTGTNGATVAYYLYFDDPTFAGGTRTLVATTNGNDVYGSSGRVLVGGVNVTFPTSGGGSGGGGGGGGGFCVGVDMFVMGERTAGESQAGALFDCVDIPRSGLATFKRRLLSKETVMTECVRFECENGAWCIFGMLTPFDLVEGGEKLAIGMLGELVLTDKGLSRVIEVRPIGDHLVCYNHFGGISYAAGGDPDNRIYSHNTNPSKP
ncbi:MAG: hypothetical protein ACREPQ_19440 [Rhodanobacter sp.]